MSHWWDLLSIYLGLLLCVLFVPVLAEDEPKTADEVISRYLSAIGAERFSSIATLEERGDVYGNVENFWQSSRSPWQSQGKEHGTFEFYFKSPNLRFGSTLKKNDTLVALHGCDGKTSWLITAFLKRIELTPKPGKEYDCVNGFEPALLVLRKANVKMRLTKKKEIDGRMAWEIRVDDPKTTGPENYYFDADTFMLLRRSRAGYMITYSDYREIGGMKFAFSEVSEFSNSKLVTTIREIKINAPIDDARFVQPILKNGKVLTNPDALAGASNSDKSPITPSSAEASNPGESVSNDSSATGNAATPSKSSAPNITAPGNTASITEVNFPNFTSCTVAELLLAVPDLKGLKPATDQGELVGLLDKVGRKTIEIGQNTPNLISHESVTELVKGSPSKHRDYDYLILTRVQGNVVDLSEFRVDIKTGDQFQTDAIMKDDPVALTELERASQNLDGSRSTGPPLSQGFATSWLHFYPPNRPQATYRYLGEQNLMESTLWFWHLRKSRNP